MKRRTWWQKFRRLLAHQFDCPASRSDWGRPTVRCDLDFGHGGLHQHFEDGECWVWATGGWYSMRIPRKGTP